MARISVRHGIRVKKKSNKAQFNSLHTGPNDLYLWPKVEAAMSKTCAAASSYKSFHKMELI